jgi:GNAT superfamily N-acetyltransferase
MISFRRTNSSDTDFKNMVVLLDQDLAIRDGDEHAFYDQFNKIGQIRHVVVCHDENTAIGCGAFKEYEPNTAEIKRMFVQPGQRGKGIGLDILKELESWAAELEYTRCILETGIKQPEAIRLYQKAGYSVMENYGQYAGKINSVCLFKNI